MNRVLRLVAASVGALLLLTGCGFKGAYSLPLPGGNAGGSVYHVTAVFDDVQDLVPMAAVRVDDVAVGDVTGIDYDPADGKAHVKIRLKKSVRLPANATATLEQTTLLGEKYVALGPPSGQAPVGRLRDGALVPADRTVTLPDVEEVFGVLSAVLNGGDLQDLQTINLEITKALAGRESVVKSALGQLDTFVGGLDQQKSRIVHAIDELDRFSSTLARQTGTIGTALDDLGPGLKVLADQRQQFVGLLSDLSRFGRIASRVITASREQTVQGLRDLQPILRHLRAAGTNLPRSLELLITYPFPRNIDKAVPGDYNGLRLSFNADPILCSIAPVPLPTCSSSSSATATGTSKSGSKPGAKTPAPTLPSLPDVTGGLLDQLLGKGLQGGTP